MVLPYLIYPFGIKTLRACQLFLETLGSHPLGPGAQRMGPLVCPIWAYCASGRTAVHPNQRSLGLFDQRWRVTLGEPPG